MGKREYIGPKKRLEVWKRDLYTCKICGKSGVELHVDHIIPVAKGGINDLSNLQTLCVLCNLGKGRNEELNRTLKNDLDAFLKSVNPDILTSLDSNAAIKVVATDSEFAEINKKNSCGNFYEIRIIPNTIIGLNACKNFGIYTLNDSGGSKTNFYIKKKDLINSSEDH